MAKKQNDYSPSGMVNYENGPGALFERIKNKVIVVGVSLFLKIHLILSVSVFSNNSSLFII